jgi:nicotinamide riboside kinase
MKVINIFGGPGVGKTTLAMDLFTALNRKQMKVEYVAEYAKELTWEEAFKTMENQRLIYSNQHNRFFRLRKKVDLVVTDAPIFNSIVYSGKGEENKFFHADVFNEFNQYENLNIFLERETEYKTHGRKQTEEEAKEVDAEVIRCLRYFKVPYVKIGLENCVETVLSLLK